MNSLGFQVALDAQSESSCENTTHLCGNKKIQFFQLAMTKQTKQNKTKMIKVDENQTIVIQPISKRNIDYV